MNEHAIVATNARQLDICLRLLYANNVKFSVIPEMVNEKMYYKIYAFSSDEVVDTLQKQYAVMIS